MTVEEILAVDERIQEPAEFVEYVAQAVAKELATEWVYISNNYPPNTMSAYHVRHDIEAVCRLLQEFGKAFQSKLENEQPAPIDEASTGPYRCPVCQRNDANEETHKQVCKAGV